MNHLSRKPNKSMNRTLARAANAGYGKRCKSKGTNEIS
jgi:hypothetical protein